MPRPAAFLALLCLLACVLVDRVAASACVVDGLCRASPSYTACDPQSATAPCTPASDFRATVGLQGAALNTIQVESAFGGATVRLPRQKQTRTLQANPTAWWMRGAPGVNNPGANATAVGLRSWEVSPSARSAAAHWTDPTNGDLYMHGAAIQQRIPSPHTSALTLASPLFLPCSLVCLLLRDCVLPGGCYDAYCVSLRSDLFRYHRGENEWELVVAGSASANRGQRGVESSLVHPGPRAFHCATVDPLSGSVFLFGGMIDMSAQVLNGELYRFNSATNRFTYLGGATSPVNQDASAVPGSSFDGASNSSFIGARVSPACWFKSGYLVLFGGGAPAGPALYKARQDVWSFHVASNTWRMHSGSTSAADAVYAVTHHEPLPTIYGMATAGPFSQDYDAPLWLHGGSAFDTLQANMASDALWELSFTPSSPPSVRWILRRGVGHRLMSTVATDLFGTVGVAAKKNLPPPVSGHTMVADASGKHLYLFGGNTRSMSDGFTMVLSDSLWRYDIPTNQWVWLRGNPQGNAAQLYPAGYALGGAASWIPRRSQHCMWLDRAGSIWIGGGGQAQEGFVDHSNDLWRIGFGSGVALINLALGTASQLCPADGCSPILRLSANEVPLLEVGKPFRLFTQTTVGGSQAMELILIAYENPQFIEGDLWRQPLPCDPLANPPCVLDSPREFSIKVSSNAATSFVLPSLQSTEPNHVVYAPTRSTGLPIDSSSPAFWLRGNASLNFAGNDATTQRVQSPSVQPGARSGAMQWTDAVDGGLYLYGGQAPDGTVYADLFRYDRSVNEWMLKRAGAAQNTAATGLNAATHPGPLVYGCAVYAPSTGTAWFYGGRTDSGALSGQLFEYDATVNLFKFVGGGLDTPVKADAVKGSAYVSSTPNLAGARENHACWASDTFLYFAGGDRFISPGVTGKSQDVWSKSLSSDQWRWDSGTQLVDAAAAAWTQAQINAEPLPFSKAAYACALTPSGWALMLHGGEVITTAGEVGLVDALWAKNEGGTAWSLFSGSAGIQTSATALQFGSKGVSAATNQPSARMRHSMAVSGAGQGEVFLHGGQSYGSDGVLRAASDDLWAFTPNPNLWTWIQGAAMGIPAVRYPNRYGADAETGAWPAARMSHSMWLDASHSLWIGFGRSSNPAGSLSDLWRIGAGTGMAYLRLNMSGQPGCVGPNSCSPYLLDGVTQPVGMLELGTPLLFRQRSLTQNLTLELFSVRSSRLGSSGIYVEPRLACDLNSFPFCNPGSDVKVYVGSTETFSGGSLNVESSFDKSVVYVPSTSPPPQIGVDPPAFWIAGTSTIGEFNGQLDSVPLPVLSPQVKPRSRNGAASWTDSRTGDLMMYGGMRGEWARDGSLWRWHRAESAWELVRAEGLMSEGTRLVQSETVHPGPRSDLCAAHDPATGFTYLFGGDIGGNVSDGRLWRYDSTANQFTFLGGRTRPPISPPTPSFQPLFYINDGTLPTRILLSWDELSMWIAREALGIQRYSRSSVTSNSWTQTADVIVLPLSGTVGSIVWTSRDPSQHILVIDRKAAPDLQVVYRFDPAGSLSVPVWTSQMFAYGDRVDLAVSDSTVYVSCIENSARLLMLDLESGQSTRQLPFPAVSVMTELCVDEINGWLYYAFFPASNLVTLQRLNVKTNLVDELAPGTPWQIELDSGTPSVHGCFVNRFGAGRGDLYLAISDNRFYHIQPNATGGSFEELWSGMLFGLVDVLYMSEADSAGNIYLTSRDSPGTIAILSNTGIAEQQAPDQTVAIGDFVSGASLNGLTGARSGAACWFSQGHVLIWGGESSIGLQTNLWAVDVLADRWWHVSGPSAGDAAAIVAGHPLPAKHAAYCGPHNTGGRMFLHGGFGHDGLNTGLLESFWSLSFNPTTHTVSWMPLGGNPSAVVLSGAAVSATNFGAKGSEVFTNLPPARAAHAMVMDVTGQRIYLYAGQSFGSDTIARASGDDLWRWSVTGLMWSWIGGHDGSIVVGSGFPSAYGLASSVYPVVERIHPCMWSDASGSLWIGFGAHDDRLTSFSDLWRWGAPTGQAWTALTSLLLQPGPEVPISSYLDWSGLAIPIPALEIGKTSTYYTQANTDREGVTLRFQAYNGSNASWRVEITTDAGSSSFSSSSDPAGFTVSVPAELAGTDLFGELILAPGTINEAQYPDRFRFSFGAPGTSRVLPLSVRSQSGASATPATMTFTVQPASNNPQLEEETSNPPPPIVVEVQSGDPDPCLTAQNPCVNGGICSSQLRAVGGSTTLQATLTCACPAGFFSATCDVGIVECVSCTAAYAGGSLIRLRGVGLANVTRIDFAGVPVAEFNFTNSVTGVISTRRRSLLALTSQVDEISLLSPMLPLLDNSTVVNGVRRSSYLAVQITVGTPSGLVAYNVSGLIYATANPCLLEGQWKPAPDGSCLPCPNGAFCPGGGRAWPLRNWWGQSEYAVPSRCPLDDTCKGTSRIGSTEQRVDSSGVVTTVKLTQQCEVGYSSVECVKCAEGFYQMSGRCWACGSEQNQTVQITLVLIAAGVVILLLSVALSFLSGDRISALVMLFVLLQRVAALGSSGSRDLPDNAQAVGTFFSLLNIINFNVEIVSPGCTVRALTWPDLFWATMAFVALTYVCFMTAAFVRYRVTLAKAAQGDLAATERGETRVDPKEDFRRRRIHITIIAGTLFYLKIVTLQIAGFRCVMAPVLSSRGLSPVEGVDVQYASFLAADLETPCYATTHGGTIAFILLSLLLYTVGFPIWIVWTLVRSFKRKAITTDGKAVHETKDERAMAAALSQYRMDCYGVMFRGLKESCYLYKIQQFVASIWFAIFTSLLVEDVPLQLFLLGLSASFQAGLAIFLLPFADSQSNVILIATTLGSFAYNILMLLLQPTDSLRATSIVLIVLFCILALAAAACLLPLARRTKVLRVTPDGAGLREVGVELASAPADTLQAGVSASRERQRGERYQINTEAGSSDSAENNEPEAAASSADAASASALAPAPPTLSSAECASPSMHQLPASQQLPPPSPPHDPAPLLPGSLMDPADNASGNGAEVILPPPPASAALSPAAAAPVSDRHPRRLPAIDVQTRAHGDDVPATGTDTH